MPTLRTDVDQIHTDGRHVLVGTMRGEILISRFKAADKHNPNGRWVGLATTDWPVAWEEIPSHPYFPNDARPLNGEVATP